MLDLLDTLKRRLPLVLAGIAGVLCLAIVIGGLFFDLNFGEVVSWFEFVVIFIFILAFVFAVLAFIGWFLFSRPVVFGWLLLSALGIFGISALFLWLMGKPMIDVGAMLEPIFSIFN